MSPTEIVRHKQGVLDTSTVVLLPRLRDPEQLPEEPLITAVILAELSVGPLVATRDAERAARQAHIQQAEADFDPLPFDASAARAFGGVAASLRQARRTARARAYDALIAATALAHGLPVYTCNSDDFADIEGPLHAAACLRAAQQSEFCRIPSVRASQYRPERRKLWSSRSEAVGCDPRRDEPYESWPRGSCRTPAVASRLRREGPAPRLVRHRR